MHLRFVCALALAWASAPVPLAQAFDLTLDQALERTLAENHDLRAAQAEVAAAERQAALDGLRPALSVGAEVENFAGTGDLEGFDDTETTLRLGRTFELGGKREARQALASARADVRRNAVARQRLDVEAETRRRFVAVVARQARLDLAVVSVGAAREMRAVVAERVERGASPDADLPLADLEVARAELEHEDAEHELASARVALSVLWGEKTPGFTRAVGSVDIGTGVPAFETLVARLSGGADERALALESASLDAIERSAKASRSPDVHGSLGVRRLEGLDDQALVLSVSVPIGLRERSDLTVDRTHAERDAFEGRRQALALERHRRLFASYEALRHARHEFEALGERMIPAAERALELSRRGYERARYSFLAVAQAQRVVHELQRDRIAAGARYQRLLADIERATALTE